MQPEIARNQVGQANLLSAPLPETSDSQGVAQQQVAEIVAKVTSDYPQLTETLFERLLQEFQQTKPEHFNQVRGLVRRRLNLSPIESNGNHPSELEDLNRAYVLASSQEEREGITEYMRHSLHEIFTADELAAIATKVVTDHQKPDIVDLAQLGRSAIFIRQLRTAIGEFFKLPKPEVALDRADLLATRAGLCSLLVSDELRFVDVAQKYFTVRIIQGILDRSIGNDTVSQIGGKAAGMLLANQIVRKREGIRNNSFLPLGMPTTRFVRADVVEEFFGCNDLEHYHRLKFQDDPNALREGYQELLALLPTLKFPKLVFEKLDGILDKFGEAPIVVRSSSLLEDRIGTAFAGKYKSVFLPNQGPRDQRLLALVGAMMEVYASTISPDAILYRKEHNLLHFREQMAVIIQRVVGKRVGNYFLPAFGGVAFSRNEYRWSPRIKREDGMMRLVFGLGTRAVDRSGGDDFPRLVALGAPTLQPQADVSRVAKASQKTVDVIDLEARGFVSVPVSRLLPYAEEIPFAAKIFSKVEDGDLRDSFGNRISFEGGKRGVVTFNNLLRSGEFVNVMRATLAALEEDFGFPVDVEFACDGEKLYILQCRPQAIGGEQGPVNLPGQVERQRTVLEAHGNLMRSCRAEGIRYIVYVSPEAYDALQKPEDRVAVARLVGHINQKLPAKSFALLGPGRWGSNDKLLGVPVTYSDLYRTALLVEIAHEKSGRLPELSYGTHFFQDLVESGIAYLPLYDGVSGSFLNADLIQAGDNILKQLLSDNTAFAHLQDVVRVVDLESTFGKAATLYIDAENSNKAIMSISS